MKELDIIDKTIKEVLGVHLYPTQIKAVKEMYRGNIVNVETGEGKTLIIAALAVMKALNGKSIVVLTPNDYLNSRDYKLCKSIADKVNLTCNINITCENGVELDKTEIYKSDIIYSTCSEFVFDFLRNRGKHKEFVADLLGKSLIIDEIDQILVDNSNTNYSVSLNSEDIRNSELSLYLTAKHFCKMLFGGEVKNSTKDSEVEDENDEFDFIFNKEDGYLFLTRRGVSKIGNLLNIKFESIEETPMYSAIYNTLYAHHILHKGVDYFCNQQEISIIDRNNGRHKKNNHFSSGINLALEIKENCKITSIPTEDRSINGLFFYSQFDDLVGCSGTTKYCKKLFREILKTDVKSIKRYKGLNVKFHKPLYFTNKEKKYNSVKDKIIELRSKGLPVLVVAENDNVCGEFFNYVFESLGEDARLLINDNLEEEDIIIKSSGNTGSVLISTLISGRGTDIIIDENLSDLGGLQVIFLSRFENIRAEKQIIGRTGRQGRKGEIYYFSSLDDNIFNHLTVNRKKKVNHYFKSKNFRRIDKEILKLQKIYERVNSSNIIALFKKNCILNMFENYLETVTSNVHDVLYEIENFMIAYSIEDGTKFSECVLATKEFVDKLLEGGNGNEYNVESSL